MEILAKNLKQREKQAMFTPCKTKTQGTLAFFQGENSAKNSNGKGN